MKTVIKLAVGAAIAGALVKLLVKRPSRERLIASKSFTLQDLRGENAEWGGGSSGLKA